MAANSFILILLLSFFLGLFSISVPLHDAVKEGDHEKLHELLTTGANVHKIDSFGYTALHEATRLNHIEFMNKILSHGGDAQAITRKHWRTPMHAAAEGNAVEAVDVLRKFGAIIDPKDVEGRTPLHLALINGFDDFAKKMLDLGASITLKSYQHMNGFHFACKHGREVIVDILLERGANINLSAINSTTPLHFAAMAGEASIAEKLLERGAKLELKATSEEGEYRTPLRIAADLGHDSFVRLLLAKGADKSQLSEELHPQYFEQEL